MGCSIAITSGKGGTGKSIVTSNLSLMLAKTGADVLILDADLKMANLSLLLDLEYPEITLNEVLSGEAELKEAVYEKYGVKIVPAGVPLSKVKKARPDKLEEVLKKIIKDVDYILIDTSPGLEVDAVSALVGADNAVLVINPEISSMVDAFKVKKVCDLLNTNILGLVINRVKYDLSELSIEEIETVLETNAIGVIPEDPIVKRSVAFGKPFYAMSPDSLASKAIYKLGKSILGEKQFIKKSKKPYTRLLKIFR
ncbi:MAG: cell division ATPase MinD [Euryarchaeota archaeon]|nr:cell division ATPase MinD [Euryarchaeota archaeon]